MLSRISQIYVHKCKISMTCCRDITSLHIIWYRTSVLSHSHGASFLCCLKWYVEAATCMYTSLNNFSCSIEFISLSLFFSCIYKYAVYAVPTYIIYIICWIAMRSTIKYQDTNNWCWWRYFNAVRRKMSIALMVYSYCNYLRWCYIFTDNSELLCGSSSFLLPHLWHLLIHQLFFFTFLPFRFWWNYYLYNSW